MAESTKVGKSPDKQEEQVQDGSSERSSGAAGTANIWDTLQGSIGNQAVGRLIGAQREAAAEGVTKIDPVMQQRIDLARSEGVPLGPGMRTGLESALGNKVPDVNLHTGDEADAMARGLNARAFTQGRDIFLRNDRSPSTPEGMTTLAHELTHVSEGRATAGTVQREEDESQPQVASGAAKVGLAGAGEGGQAPPGRVAGAIEPIEMEAEVVEDAVAGASSAPKQAVAPPQGGRPARPLPVVASLSFDSEIRPGSIFSHSRAASDAVAATLTGGTSVTQGKPFSMATTFGEEVPKYTSDTVTWTKGATNVDLKGRIFVACTWDVRSLGRTSISGPADPTVTKDKYAAIQTDLTPDGTGRPTRDTYWAQDLTERHEKFHASDDIFRAAIYMPTVKGWLDTQTITDPTNVAATNAEVSTMMSGAVNRMVIDRNAYYAGGGETRAYADGKALYQARVDAINKRAVTEGWAVP